MTTLPYIHVDRGVADEILLRLQIPRSDALFRFVLYLNTF